jgi:prolyl-tRNA synthetase
LPLNVYQIQTKFRDEIRPRFGIMRAREFLMKDAYSFHIDQPSLDKEYQNMYDTYARIFTRLGLKFRAVKADSGAIGGSMSHEFQVLADSGEDAIVFSDGSDYTANMELAEALAPIGTRPAASAELKLIDTPTQKTIEELSSFLKVDPKRCVKTLIVRGEKGLVALCLRGDHEINETKVAKLPELPGESVLADEGEIWKAIQCKPGFIGPVKLPADMPVIVDRDAAQLADFVCGANQAGKHYTGANWERDARITRVVDLRKAQVGDASPDGKGKLDIARGIEVGHVFSLGDKYAKAMNASVLDQTGKQVTLLMGCYGIGVSRIAAAAIEQNHDERGIIWPAPLAPFDIALLPLNMAKSEKLKAAAEKLYAELQAAGYEVLMDDRDLRPGPMFADAELIGIPHRLVLSDRGLDAGTVEYKGRTDADKQDIPAVEIMEFVRKRIRG